MRPVTITTQDARQVPRVSNSEERRLVPHANLTDRVDWSRIDASLKRAGAHLDGARESLRRVDERRGR